MAEFRVHRTARRGIDLAQRFPLAHALLGAAIECCAAARVLDAGAAVLGRLQCGAAARHQLAKVAALPARPGWQATARDGHRPCRRRRCTRPDRLKSRYLAEGIRPPHRLSYARRPVHQLHFETARVQRQLALEDDRRPVSPQDVFGRLEKDVESARSPSPCRLWPRSAISSRVRRLAKTFTAPCAA